MNGSKQSMGRDFDRDDAPDLSPGRLAREVRQGNRSPRSSTLGGAKGVDHHPPVTGGDRSLQGRRAWVADKDRRGSAGVDQEPRIGSRNPRLWVSAPQSAQTREQQSDAGDHRPDRIPTLPRNGSSPARLPAPRAGSKGVSTWASASFMGTWTVMVRTMPPTR